MGAMPCACGLRAMLGVVAQEEQSAVDFGVQRLDPAVHHLGEAGDVGNIGDGEAGVAQGLGGAAGGDEFVAGLGEGLGEIDEAGFIGDGEEGAFGHGSVGKKLGSQNGPRRGKKTGKLLRHFGPGICSLFLKIMADVANRYPENLAGKYYVDNQCIDCDLCRETAPSNFGRNDDGGYSYVYKQPTTPEEEKLCKEAMEGCPVEAIGDNGS